MHAAIQKALLEGLRIVAISVIPIIIDGLSNGVVDLRLVAITGAITALRFIDKLLHELGKETESEVLVKGLTRF